MPSLKTVLLALVMIWGIPLFHLRHRWRATVYRRDDWKIDVLPWFGHDIAALFTNRYFLTDEERAMARKFRWYLAGYLTLLALFVWGPE